MRALTLTQPWATLVATTEKMNETRSWGTSHRGPLAIHAAQGLGSVGGMRGLAALIETEPFKTALAPHLSGYTPEERAADLPRGGIVAVASVEDVRKIEPRADFGKVRPALGTNERAFGDYTVGRYVWEFRRCVNVHDPIECKGALGLWTVPEAIRRELALITDMAWTEDEDARFQELINTPDVERDAAIRAAIMVAKP